MRIELRSESVLIEGYVNAVGRDSRVLTDKNGTKFIEQIKPGVFARAIEKAKEPIQMLLNHEETRVLGNTQKNLKLKEDNIGLYASCETSDPEVMQKAREKKLRGWSFAFFCTAPCEEEDLQEGIKRRIVTEMDLKEVSIIDEKKLPCYIGTSVSTRAEDTTLITRAEEFSEENYVTEKRADIDLSSYKKRIESLEG